MAWSKTVKPTISFSRVAKPSIADNFVFQDGNNFVFQDSNNFVLDINIAENWNKVAKPT